MVLCIFSKLNSNLKNRIKNNYYYCMKIQVLDLSINNQLGLYMIMNKPKGILKRIQSNYFVDLE